MVSGEQVGKRERESSAGETVALSDVRTRVPWRAIISRDLV